MHRNRTVGRKIIKINLMRNVLLKNTIIFLILILVQVTILNNIQFSGYINPYLYVIFILLLPFRTPGWLLLISSFFLGLIIDIFCNTPGMHTISSVFIAFCRPFLLNILASKEDYEELIQPTIKHLGLTWYIVYSAILVFLHHFILFFVEVFSFHQFFLTLLKIFLSLFFTLLFVFITQYLFFEKKER